MVAERSARKQIEKCVRIEIISSPCVAADIKIATLAPRLESLPLLVLQFYFDIENLFPHALDRFGDLAVSFESVEVDRYLRETFPVRIARFGKKPFCLLRVIFRPFYL